MTEGQRRAIIDIGSNTIRLVVFGGAPRVPVVLYNEKLMAGLGRGVYADGRISSDAKKAAIIGLTRFKTLVDAMDVATLRVVATAAVRDASNGKSFLDDVRNIGLPVEMLTGEEEAIASGFGVVSAIPGADGVVADLGGGSLELVRVADGTIQEQVSLPIGILGVAALRAQGLGKLRRHVQNLIAQIPWAWRCDNLPLYLVGGSWRSLARVHIHQTGFPLSVLGNYSFDAAEARPLSDAIQLMDKASLKAIPSMPTGRVPMVPDSASLLAALVEAISPSKLVSCAYGLREGLLFQLLEPSERALDPLIEGVRFAAAGQDQLPGHGEALTLWLDRLFVDESPGLARLRHAVSLMVGTGWASNPDFRALSGEELALHGNWAGVDARDRAIMGMALYVGLGGTGETPSILRQLADEQSLAIAASWGHALRLAQRLSGGAASLLSHTGVVRQSAKLELKLPASLSSLEDETVQRRLDRLAHSMGAQEAEITIGD